MKRNLLSFLLLGVALTMLAQSLVKVKYQGAKPTITDFVSAYLAPAAADDEEAMECDGEAVAWLKQAWESHLKGQKQAEGVMPSFALPRSGKDITATLWFPSGMKQQKILKWNGNGFSK